MPPESNRYVSAAPAAVSTSTTKNIMDTVKDVIGKLGKKAAKATTKAQDLAADMKTSPNVADAAVSRIAQQGKVVAEGRYEKVFQQTVESLPEEQLRKCDNPLSYKNGGKTEWSYYKLQSTMWSGARRVTAMEMMKIRYNQ